MKDGRARLLAVVGIVIALIAWEAAVAVTRPPPALRATIGLSSVGGDVTFVVLDLRGRDRGAETIALADAAARLRTVLSAEQPTLAAIPTEDSDARKAIERAKAAYGGGLEIVAVDAPGAPADAARRRASALQHARSTPTTWLPTASEAVRALYEMTRSGEMPRHIVASLFRVMAGFVLASVLGIPFGMLIGASVPLRHASNGVIQFLRPISPIAWLPVATLLIGGGDLAAIFLIFLASFFPITIGTASAVSNIDMKVRRAATNFGVRGIDRLRRVTLPAALPGILASVRIAIGISWVVVVAAEMLGVESGLGYLVLDARNQLRYDRVVAAMLVIGGIGVVVDSIVRSVERGELERRGMHT